MRKLVLLSFVLLSGIFTFGQTIFTQNFEGSWTTPPTLSPAWSGTTTPADNVWHRNDYTTGWAGTSGAYTPTGANSTTYSARFHSYDAASGTTGDFITPVIDMSAYTAGNLRVKFYYINTSGTDVLNVYSSNDGGTTWSGALGSALGVAAAWTEYTFILPGNSATTKIKLTATGDYGVTDIGVDEFRVLNPVIPAPPTNFTATAVTQGGMTIGWTDNSNNEVGFRVYRSTDGINYVQSGTDITSTSVGTSGTLYSQVQTGLSAGVTYYFRIASYADAESSFLTGSQITLPPTPRCGTKNVGPTGDYLSLTDAFTDLATNGITCTVNLVLQATYVSTVETFPILVNPINGTSSTNKVNVYPSVTGLSITSINTTGTINLNGVNYVYFDGRVNAAGSVKDLVIENSSTTAYTIQFINGASNNAVQYCIVKSVSTSTTIGVINFAGTTTLTGNSNNLINQNEIRDGATTPLYMIMSTGNYNQVSAYNSNNVISNNNIHDFYAPAGGNPIGVYINTGSTAWTISGNSFYQTVPRSPTVANGYNVMLIVPGDGYSITGNYIGGSAPNCGGTPWTLNGNGSPPTIANFIYVIRFQTSVLSVNPNSVQGNTIANISLFTNPAAASIYFVGLLGVAGILNVGDVTPNVIGSATGTGSITITIGNGAYAAVFEGFDFRGISGNVKNNVVGSITMQGVAGSTSTYAQTFRAMGITPTVQNAPVVVSGNLIGSTTTAGSIQCPAQTNPYMDLQGIFVSSVGAGTMSITGNTLANWTNLNAGVSSYNMGIYNAGAMIPSTIVNNTIRDFTCAAANTTITAVASNMGIYSNNSMPGELIRGNTIYNFSNTSTGAIVAEHGIYVSSAAGSMLCEKNFIHSFSTNSGLATALMTGIYINAAGTFGVYKNNMIRLGINNSGTSMGDNAMIYGIYETGATNDSILNNSVYVGGTVTAGVTGNTYAYYSTITTFRTIYDNIFFNARSGGTTGLHYAIGVGGTTMYPFGLMSNYNILLSNGAVGSMFGRFNAVNLATIGNWKIATGMDMASGNTDPNFIAPLGTSATVNLHVQNPTPAEASGIAIASVTDDFDGQARSGLTPVDIGADAGNFTATADVFGPNITYTALGSGIVAANRTLNNWAVIVDNIGVSTGASLPRIYYKKSTESDAFVGNTNANNGWKYVIASNSTSPFSFTINYGLLTAPVANGDIIQYFVVAQDAANNLSSLYQGAAASGNPPVQNINVAPPVATVQSYLIAGGIPTVITVPGSYPTLTGAGGAFEAINNGVIVGNTVINITADVVEPGTVALNQFSEDPPNSNFTLTVKPDASTLRTLSGTATLAAGAGLIRSNGADRFIIDGGAGKNLTFRFTNATATGTGPTIQYQNGSTSDVLMNCTIENNGTTTTNGTINISNSAGTPFNQVSITGNNIRESTAGTIGIPYSAIYSNTNMNTLSIQNNNIFNFSNYGAYMSAVNDGCTITGNSFYYNSATAPTATQYCIYIGGLNTNHVINNNYMGGQSPLCAGSAWNNTGSVSFYGIFAVGNALGVITMNNNTIQNINMSSVSSPYIYGIYAGNGAILSINNNLIGSTTVPTSITLGGTGYFYGIYCYASALSPTNIQGNTISGINQITLGSSYFYGIYISSTNNGLYYIGTTTGNVIGSNTVANAIPYGGNGYWYGIYSTSSNQQNAIENNIIGNISLTATSGSPYFRGMYIYSANVRKNKIFNIGATNAALTPYLYGIYNYGVSGQTNEYSNNLISLNAGAATNPTIYGFYDGSYATANYRLYFNSISINGAATGTSSTYAYYRSVAATYTLMNNIFSNTRVPGGTGKHYACYISSIGFLSSNYNDLYSTNGYLGYYNAVDILTLSSWQSATYGDANSKSVDPLFVSASDLHTARPELNGTGIVIPSVTTDYAGATRGNPPDIGAFEFSLPPTVITNPATAILTTSATLNGSVNANGASTTVTFDYGQTIGYGSSVSGGTVNGSTALPVSGSVTSLLPNTLYHFRAVGVNSVGPAYGNDLTFTTAAAPPAVVTTPATNVLATTATLNGTVNANNATTTVSFDYGLTTSYGTNVVVPGNVTGNSAVPCLTNISSLLPGNTYHFRINGTNSGGTTNGNDMTFTTPALPPVAITLPATNVLTSSATLNGTIDANGAATTVTFEYGQTITYGTTVAGVPPTITGNGALPSSANITGLVVNTLYHYRIKGVNSAGNTNGNDMTFTTGCQAAQAAGTISGPSQVCQGGCGYVYTVPPIVNATGYAWTLPTGGTITSGANTNSITVCFSTSASSGYVSVYGTSVCGNGAPSQYPVNVNSATVPSLTGPTPVCANSTGNLYTTQSGMTNYVWAITGGTITNGGNSTSNTATVTWTTPGTQSISVNFTNAAGCTGSTPTVKNVVVNAAPTPTITGPATACTGITGLIYSTQTGMTGYTWTISAGGTITAGNGTSSVTVTWITVGAQTISVNYSNANGCSAPAPVPYNVTVSQGVSPTITGNNNLCVNSGNYTYTTQTGFLSYMWSISGGGSIITGQGTSSVTVSWGTAGAQWIAVNYSNAAGCSAQAPVQFPVTVNPLPDNAGSITGTAAVCGGITGIAYSIAPVANANAYVWSLPAGATIASGFNTNAITVNFAANASSGNITVYPNNLCGNGNASPPFAVTVTPLPDPAGTITGQSTVCTGAMGIAYSVPMIPNATGYTWTLPSGATIASGGNTNAILVDFSNSAVSGNITVTGTNSCGNGTVSSNFAVTVNPTPQTPTVSANGETLTSSAPAGNQWYFEGTAIPGANGQTHIAENTGFYWVVVTLNGCSSDTSNHVYVLIDGLETIAASQFSIYPVPNDGQFTASMFSDKPGIFAIQVFNNLGVKIFEQNEVEVNGKVEKQIDLRPIPAGIYSIIFRNNTGKIVKKIIINN